VRAKISLHVRADAMTHLLTPPWMQAARSLVMKPASTVLMHTSSRVSPNLYGRMRRRVQMQAVDIG
jgi:hypothetical protein